jgi:hypothetical protein
MTSEQKKKLLKAKIAVALHNELLIPAQKAKGKVSWDLLALASWKGLYQARPPIGGRVAACGPGNCTRRVGSNMRSPMPWG